MGNFGSKESQDGTMDEGRESPPRPPDDQQTTSEEDSESVIDLSSSSHEDPSDLSEEQEDSVGTSDEAADNVNKSVTVSQDIDLHTDFADAVETFFARAENSIQTNRFDLPYAKDFVITLRDVGQRHLDRGCEEKEIEAILVQRALKTVYQLIDGVNENQTEVYDPRQTMVYLYCAMAVFPSTLLLEGDGTRIRYRFSTTGNDCLSQFQSMDDYCSLKTACEGTPGWQNLILHQRFLINMAAWLEMDRAPVAYMITCRSIPFLSIITEESRQIAYLPQMNGVSEKLQGILYIGMVVSVSSLIRAGLVQEAQRYRRPLREVDISRLPHALAARYSHVLARLLHRCGVYHKALDYAEDALKDTTDSGERQEIIQLISELRDAQERAVYTYDIRGPPEQYWLKGTHASYNQERTHLQDAVREQHLSRSKHQRARRVPVPKRGSTPSPSPPAHRGYPSGDLQNVRGGSASGNYSSSPCLASLTFPPARAAHPDCHQGAAFVDHGESLPHCSDSDDSDEPDDNERDICFLHAYGKDDDDGHVEHSTLSAEDENEQNWFEKSEEAIANRDLIEVQDEAIELSETLLSKLNTGGKGRAFYQDFYENPWQFLKSNPKKYKRCQLKIERAHKSIAKVLDKDSKYSEILIDGRSKAGRTYMDDEVVVEIVAEPGKNNGQQAAKTADSASVGDYVETMAHGKVVGLLKRVNFANVEHPVLYCTLDEIEGHLMRPLCKTVPKIHVMNDGVIKKFPTLKKHKVEIKTISPDGDIKHKGFCNVEPDKREQYVFKVVMLGWRKCNIYPLGAVLDYHIGGRDYASGLRILSMQQRVPELYTRGAVEDTNNVVQQPLIKRGREDLTGERLFTIDPSGSKDLDDAISIKKEGSHYVIGVHIADVAAVVKPDSKIDKEARERAVTFYPLDRQPRCMLPEPLSHGKCSLLPHKERLAFSVFFTFDKEFKQVNEPFVKRSVIRSNRQLTYEEAQRVIDDCSDDDIESGIQDDIRQIHKITSKLREARIKGSVLFVPFEDPRLYELERIEDSQDSHSLIEELMILTNSYIASRFMKRPRLRDLMIVRSHKAPTWEELAEWQEKGQITDLVMGLQGKKVTPSTELSLNNRLDPRSPQNQFSVVVQKEVWEKLCQHLERGEAQETQRLACMDHLHPLQCLATNDWMDLMETAQYKCPHGLNRPDLRHFGLDLDIYTHFTSPIRRYVDLHVQRLLHADLNGETPSYSTAVVDELCQHINSVNSRQKAFGKGCKALKMAENLQNQPLVFRAYVESVDTEQLTVSVPSLRAVSDRRQQLSFSMLGVSHQPELVTSTTLKQNFVTVRWNKKVFDTKGAAPARLLSVWKYFENRGGANDPQSSATDPSKKMKKIPPLTLFLSPDQLTVSVKRDDWADILKSLVSNRRKKWRTVPQPLSRSLRPALSEAESTDFVEVDYMSLEKGDGMTVPRPVHFKRVYTKGQVVQLQMSAEPKKGLLSPRVDILHTARNASVCTQHVSDPLSLCRFATRATRDKQFSSHREYAGAWMPLMEMEAAMEVSNCDGCIVIENVDVNLKQQSSDNDILYRGTFKLGAKFCFDRCIAFGGKSADSIREDEFKSDNSYPLDYLCLRYKMDCSDKLMSRIRQSKTSETVDKHLTWLAHAQIVRVNHIGKREDDGGHLQVTFVLTKSSPQPPPALMTKPGAKLTLEILPKSDVYRRAQKMLLCLEDPKCVLAQAIAFGRSIPKLDKQRRRLGKKDENHEVYIEGAKSHLPRNNKAQLDAIQMAMTNSLTLIQGPPGTGKTNTGIKLVYLFSKINRQLAAEGERKTVLYCGPSNKSVDLVARELKRKLGDDCPKIVRVYGSAIETKDYPVPGGDPQSTRSVRDLSSDPALQDVTLHHLIRQDDRKYAEQICRFDKYFEKCIRKPNEYKVTSKQIKDYRKLVRQASQEELAKYEVVLATCSVGGNPKVITGTRNSIYQVIIDECAMSTEPQSMVPIIATQASQVVLIGDHKQLRPIIKCSHAAEMGLDQSLFERLFLKFPTYKVFLDIQYRMHPEICAFPSKEFYDNELRTAKSNLWCGMPRDPSPRQRRLLSPWGYLPCWHRRGPDDIFQIMPHLLINVQGEEETLSVTTEEGNEKSKSNSLEADKVIEILTYLKREFEVETSTVKILTQYNAQRHLLEQRLKRLCEDRSQTVFNRYDKNKLDISTVVSSQGGEWDYVILSTVRSLPDYRIEPNPTLGWNIQNLGFITDKNQVNVALTRARRGIFIVGNVALLRCDTVWRHLVERYEKQGCYVEDPQKFPPPPTPLRQNRNRRGQQNATHEWQKVPTRRCDP